MPQWEYCNVIWMVRRASDEERRDLENQGFEGLIQIIEDEIAVAMQGILNFLGSSQEPMNIVDLENTIAQLGQDGWELASHTEVTSPTTAQIFYFKREQA